MALIDDNTTWTDKTAAAPPKRPRSLVIGREYRGLYFDLSHYETGKSVPNHFHTEPSFCFVLDGLCLERNGKSISELDRGTLIYHSSGSEHGDQWNIGGRCLYVGLMASFCHEHDIEQSAFDSKRIRGFATDCAARICNELLHPDSSSDLALSGLVLTMIAESNRTPIHASTPPNWLRRVRSRLEHELDSPPSLGQIAQDNGVHPVHLASTFQHHYGETVGEFVRSCRVDRARHMLASGDEPLARVALDLGFADQSHFSRTFKKHTGFTPREYRKGFGRPMRTDQKP